MAKTTVFILSLSLFYSIVSANSWTLTKAGSPGPIYCISGRDSLIIAGSDSGKVHISYDYGKSWKKQSLENNSACLGCIRVIAILIEDSTILVGTRGGLESAIYSSVDRGVTWKRLSSNLHPQANVRTFIRLGNTLVSFLYNAVWISKDNGSKWSEAMSGIDSADITALTACNGKLYAVDIGNKAYISTDSGSKWTPLSVIPTATYVVSISAEGTNIYAGTMASGAFISRNNGATWATANIGMLNGGVYNIIPCGDTVYFSLLSYGVTTYNPVLNSFGRMNTGLSYTNISCLSLVNNLIYSGFADGSIYLLNNSNVGNHPYNGNSNIGHTKPLTKNAHIAIPNGCSVLSNGSQYDLRGKTLNTRSLRLKKKPNLHSDP